LCPLQQQAGCSQCWACTRAQQDWALAQQQASAAALA
jgi:hypothetical protein